MNALAGGLVRNCTDMQGRRRQQSHRDAMQKRNPSERMDLAFAMQFPNLTDTH